MRCSHGCVQLQAELGNHLWDISRAGFNSHHQCLDDVLQEMARISQTYGFSVTVEPRTYHGEDRRRPDILYHLGLRSVAIDLTVVDATCPSHAPESAHSQGRAAAIAAKDKIIYHSARVESFGHTFFPVALEALGHMDSMVTDFVRRLARELSPHLRVPFSRSLLHAIATTSQSGSAAIIDTARRRLRSRASLVHC